MKLIEGNSYICLEKLEISSEHTFPVGAICYAFKDGFCGYVDKGVLIRIKLKKEYEKHFTLYEESPYNKERRLSREKFAGKAMEGLLAAGEINLDSNKAIEYLAKTSVKIADALIKELEKGE